MMPIKDNNNFVIYCVLIICLPIIISFHDVANLVVDNLTSNTTYIFRIYARNDVGSSQPTELLATTDEVRE